MTRCDAEDECKTPDEDMHGVEHYFCGYEYYEQFHEVCCPRWTAQDGTWCQDHEDSPDVLAPPPTRT